MMKEDRGVKQEKYEQEIVTDDNQVVSPPPQTPLLLDLSNAMIKSDNDTFVQSRVGPACMVFQASWNSKV